MRDDDGGGRRPAARGRGGRQPRERLPQRRRGHVQPSELRDRAEGGAGVVGAAPRANRREPVTITDNIATMFERSAERLGGPAGGDRRTDRVTWAIDRFKRAFELIDEIGKLIGSSDGRSLGHTALGYVPRIAARLKVPSERRDQLSRVVQDCKRALNSINELGSDAPMLQRLMLKKTVEECEGAIAEVDEVEPSSGDQASRARRTLTVELAVELILKFGDRMPTVILVNEVADMLYELVTEKVPSNMDEY